MIILGIESTAHTFGAAVVKNKKILSNVKKLYTTKSGGIIPYEVAEHHTKVAAQIIGQALKEAQIKPQKIDLIAYSASPGLGHCLRIGAVAARTLALKLNKKMVPVNHCIAHLEIGRVLSGFEDPLLVYVSGANTQIIGFEGGKYRVFGETLDVGVGNFLDSFAREIDLGFPGGPKIEKLALKGNFVELPYVVKGMDLALGGISTKLKRLLQSHSKEDLCFSVQETVFAMITEITERALSHTKKNQVVLGGGVACNKRLQQMIKDMCDERGAKFFVPKNEFLVDNAAMIALAGSLTKKTIDVKDSFIDPYLRTDEVEIDYRSS